MLSRVLLAALIAGMAGAIVATAFQAVQVWPLIHEAEVFEQAAEGAQGHAHDHGQGHGHDGEHWAPGDGAERVALTFLANLVAGIGFALMLCAGALLHGSSGWRAGLVWGLAGYAAFVLAPALGLPPLLPGMAAAGVEERQLWWLLAAAGAAGGLGLIAFTRSPALVALGVMLVVAPHVVGAPRPPDEVGAVPGELAAAFVSASLVSNLLFWLTVGAVSGLMLERLAARQDAPAPA